MDSSFLPDVGEVGFAGDDLWLPFVGDAGEGESSYYIVRFFVINSS